MGPFPKIINTRNQQAQAMRKETKVLKKSTKKVHVRVWVKDQWVDGTIANTAATAADALDRHMVKLAAGGVAFVQLRVQWRWHHVRRIEEF
jgi:hypothetical protein